MDNKTTIVVAWFGAAWTALIFTLILLIYLSTTKIVDVKNQDFRLYAALPQRSTEAADSVITQDARAKIVENFFKKYNSLLVNYSEAFILVADKYSLDYRLLPSIAMQESNGGKKVIKNSNNPFGYGIYGPKVLKFSSWEEGIERVGRGLREDYLNEGLTSPYAIMTKYTPSSVAKGNAWAKGVSSFMEELQ